jgi:hypothetical protein
MFVACPAIAVVRRPTARRLLAVSWLIAHIDETLDFFATRATYYFRGGVKWIRSAQKIGVLAPPVAFTTLPMI